MLKAFARWILRNDAPATVERPQRDSLTREQVTEMLDEYMKEISYEWTEWYEKFNKLHLRLAKRAQRSQSGEQQQQPLSDGDQPTPRSVLNYRRMGSV